jgi:four helix bundle protein
MGKLVGTHRDLDVWNRSFQASMRIFEHSKLFPREEVYSLTDQIRRSSRSVTTNIAEAWRKRRYRAAFISKLNDAEAEAAETQDWLHYAVECSYLSRSDGRAIFKEYDAILKTLVGMITHANTWVLPIGAAEARERERNS